MNTYCGEARTSFTSIHKCGLIRRGGWNIFDGQQQELLFIRISLVNRRRQMNIQKLSAQQFMFCFNQRYFT
jgi:hypothetical protein